jgi:hypothetical protein
MNCLKPKIFLYKIELACWSWKFIPSCDFMGVQIYFTPILFYGNTM